MTDITEEDRERVRVWLGCITPDGQVDEATVDDYFAQLEVVRAQAREEGWWRVCDWQVIMPNRCALDTPMMCSLSHPQESMEKQ